MTFNYVIFDFVFVFYFVFVFVFSFLFKKCTVGLYVSLCLMILCPFLHCKALRAAMYKRYINSIIIIIIIQCYYLFLDRFSSEGFHISSRLVLNLTLFMTT